MRPFIRTVEVTVEDPISIVLGLLGFEETFIKRNCKFIIKNDKDEMFYGPEIREIEKLSDYQKIIKSYKYLLDDRLVLKRLYFLFGTTLIETNKPPLVFEKFNEIEFCFDIHLTTDTNLRVHKCL